VTNKWWLESLVFDTPVAGRWLVCRPRRKSTSPFLTGLSTSEANQTASTIPSSPWPGLLDPVFVSVPIDAEILLKYDIFGKRQDGDLVVRMELAHEIDRGILNSRQVEFGAAAGVQNERGIDRLVGGGKPGDFLWYAILKYREILLCKIGDPLAFLES
jgi:hypothetical protein